MSQSKIFDCIIIGAGWSGAVAARELASKGHSVLVLEARDRIGGRAKTWVKGDTKIDVGCSWIHGYLEGNPTRYLAKELGVTAHLPKPAEGVIYGPDGPLSSATANALRASLSAAQASLKTPHPAPSSSASLASGLFAESSPLFKSSQAPSDPATADVSSTSPANPSDANSAARKSAPAVDQKLAKDLARSLEIPLGLTLEQASLRWAGWETTTSYAGSDAAPEGGYEALVGKVFTDAEAKGATVELNAAVTGIKEASEGVKVETQKGEYAGKTVICTIPLAVLKTVHSAFFQPYLPPHLEATIKGTHVGVLEKLLLQYPTAWWPNAASTGSYTFLPTSSTRLTESSTPEEIFNGSTLVCANFACPSLPNPSPTLLTYLSETPARLLLAQPTDKVVEGYHNFLVSRFQPSSAPSPPTSGEMTNWLTDPLCLGATTTPSVVSDHGERSPMDFKELGRPVWAGKLGFAGEHTEMEHRGSVAGAVISGQREAERVMRLLAKERGE